MSGRNRNPHSPIICFLYCLSYVHFLCGLSPSGHLLGLSHDDSKFCEENFGLTEDKRLMSSILTSIDASKPWSKCTSATMTEFLDDGHGMYHQEHSGSEQQLGILGSFISHLFDSIHLASRQWLRQGKKRSNANLLFLCDANVLGGITAVVCFEWNDSRHKQCGRPHRVPSQCPENLAFIPSFTTGFL